MRLDHFRLGYCHLAVNENAKQQKLDRIRIYRCKRVFIYQILRLVLRGLIGEIEDSTNSLCIFVPMNIVYILFLFFHFHRDNWLLQISCWLLFRFIVSRCKIRLEIAFQRSHRPNKKIKSVSGFYYINIYDRI